MSPSGGNVKQPQPFRFEWEQALRTSNLRPATARCIGYVAATWASPDGADVRPGVARLAAASGWSPRVVKSALKTLRVEGWLVRTRQGNSRSMKADEYRLAIPDEVQLTTSAETEASLGAANDIIRCGKRPDQVQLTTSLGAGNVPPPVQDHNTTNTEPLQRTVDAWLAVEARAKYAKGEPLTPLEEQALLEYSPELLAPSFDD